MPMGKDEYVMGKRCRAMRFTRSMDCRILCKATELAERRRGISKSGCVYERRSNNEFIVYLSSNVNSKVRTYERDRAIIRLLRRFVRSKFSRRATTGVMGSTLMLGKRRNVFSAISVYTISLCAKVYGFLGTKTTSAFVGESR